MYEINRSVVLVIPQEPFWTWLESLPDSELDDFDLEDLQEDANAYLIQSCEDLDEAWDEVIRHMEQIFSAELADWCEDTSLWPDLHVDIFTEWFDIQIATVLTDLSAQDIEREAFEPIVINPDA